MDSGFSTSNREKLQSWLRYYEDLGIRAFYRDRAPRRASTDETVTGIQEKETAEVATAKPAPPAQSRAVPKLHLMGRGPSLFEAAERVEGDSLERICGELAGCTRCKLHRRRTNIVFGVGNPHAELVFVGEGPGHDEDVQGIPFVGRAGQLLTQMINAMGLSREDVYIANVVKCRPPENRAPEKDEVATCLPFLLRQLTNINPKVIVCLGSVAAQALLNTNKAISHFRGQWLDFRGAKLMATYHPAYLLRNPHAKPEVWADLKKVMAFLGLTPPKGKRA
ncbi:MAG TPA: uracil-DNA glycosylase [Rugosimonospora sp.]|jgi:DNA polymerase|nr:uracil-DNA glycosylase [Rugosimonospora sp.]